MDKYYFYVGMDKPKLVNLNDLMLDHNYLGDITSDFLQEHEEMKDDSDVDYNNELGLVYGVLRNPSIETLREINKHYGLSQNDYLEDFKG